MANRYYVTSIRLLRLATIILPGILLACSGTPPTAGPTQNLDTADLLIVDCLLPPQVRQLGTRITYLAQRRAVRTSGHECALRGGEYVAHDQADFRSALSVWRPLAEEGDAQAQTYVGEIYEKGLGTQADYQAAALWYERAAKQHYPRAQINLGFLYESGLGVSQDLPRALNLYRDAAGFSNSELQFVSSIQVADREMAADSSVDLSDEMQALEQKISQRSATFEKQKQQIAQAELDIQTLQQQLNAQSDSAKPALQAAPLPHIKGLSINIIEPPVMMMRGMPTLSGSQSAATTLIGKIDPADSLFAFLVNGQEYPVSETGLFRVEQNPSHGEDLQLLAIDKAGASTRLNLRMSATSTEPSASAMPGSTRPEMEKRESPVSLAGIDFGEYHALIIGNDAYETLSTLQTATNDAIEIERVLREQYGFKTMLLLNANQKTTLTALERLRATLKERDNLVIYYAGHGELDAQSGRGYWLPVDAEPDNRKYWISNSDITAVIDSMAAKHVLVVADSCYSGTLTRSSVARALPRAEAGLERKWLQAITQSKVRTVLSSGGIQPVLDSLPNSEHSVFAEQFIKALTDNDDVLATYSLFYQIQQPVAKATAAVNVQQIPQYTPIRHAGHQAGEFIFVPAARIAAN